MSTTDKSPISVTASNSVDWQAMDRDVLEIWPEATGYSLYLFWNKTDQDYPDLAILWEVFGTGKPLSLMDQDLDQWVDRSDKIARAQSVFRMPSVIDDRPVIVYRSLGAPTPEMVSAIITTSS